MARKVKQNENMRSPDDTTEEIIRTLSGIILSSIQRLSDEDLEDVDPMKLMKQASDLIRIAVYKRTMDIKNKKLSEVGFESVKDKVFDGLSRQYPDLYEKLAAAIDELSLDIQSGDEMSAEEKDNYGGEE